MCDRFLIVFCFVLGIAITNLAVAQQVILNTSGERVVIYPDGSWRHYEAADSVLLDKQLKKEDLLMQNVDPAASLSDPGQNPDGIEKEMRLAVRFAEHTAKAAREANIALSKLIDDKFETEAQLQQAYENADLLEPDRIASLEDDLDAVTEEIKAARKHYKKTVKFADKAQKVVEMRPRKRGRRLNKLMIDYRAYNMSRQQTAGALQSVPGTSHAGHRTSPPSAPDVTGRASPPMQHLPPRENFEPARVPGDPEGYEREPRPCKIVRHEIDPASQEMRVVVGRRTLFTHTDDELRPYFRQKELITCSAQLTQIDDNVYLSVEFSIASPNARKNFGSLENGSLLRLRLLDNEEISLYNLRADRGRIDPYSGNTIFIGQYLLEKDARKVLAQTELDKMRVVWSTGYEDYEVYAVDFFIDQFACLNSL